MICCRTWFAADYPEACRARGVSRAVPTAPAFLYDDLDGRL